MILCSFTQAQILSLFPLFCIFLLRGVGVGGGGRNLKFCGCGFGRGQGLGTSEKTLQNTPPFLLLQTQDLCVNFAPPLTPIVNLRG